MIALSAQFTRVITSSPCFELRFRLFFCKYTFWYVYRLMPSQMQNGSISSWRTVESWSWTISIAHILTLSCWRNCTKYRQSTNVHFVRFYMCLKTKVYLVFRSFRQDTLRTIVNVCFSSRCRQMRCVSRRREHHIADYREGESCQFRHYRFWSLFYSDILLLTSSFFS